MIFANQKGSTNKEIIKIAQVVIIVIALYLLLKGLKVIT